MAVTLASLIGQVESKVPARGGAPANYGQIVQDAVLQLSADLPVVRVGSIDVTSGTATYALPTDFLFLISIEPMASASGVLVAEVGLIPVPAMWQERYSVDGASLTFEPTPTYTMARKLRYAARHVLTEDTHYEQLTENGARIALLYAQYLALGEQANAVAGDAWRYQIGDEMVDKTKQRESLYAQAQGWLTAYQRAVADQKRSVGSRGGRLC